MRIHLKHCLTTRALCTRLIRYGGMYKIKDGSGQHIIAPLKGHYLEFLQVD
ncbi:hypothetical protein [Enterobacter phage N5822]|nr:hypothetical protein [Enterobacter phage N5822]